MYICINTYQTYTTALRYFSTFLMLISFVLSAQTQISGIINDYSKVNAVDIPCNYVTAQNPEYFSMGDRVLLIQMKGATIDPANTAAFGNILSIGDAGNYEFNEIVYIDVDKLYMKYTMRPYTAPSGLVQVIRVPQYTDVEINGILTAKAWDGNIGGVLVFEASGTVTMNADIDVSGLGFRGGTVNTYWTGSSCTPNTNYTLNYNATTYLSGLKGESIGEAVPTATNNHLCGKGKLASGGGAGNNHNNGGGGGGNFGAGGLGGNRVQNINTGSCGNGCNFTSNSNQPGIGGISLSSYVSGSNKIFLGGGGGGGHQNNSTTLLADKGNGGGIVLIKASSIVNNSHSIFAKGVDVYPRQADGTILPTGWDLGDGNNGGGGGGTILLNVTTSITNTLYLNVKGGNGGYTNDGYAPTHCRKHGPGGGGGGGVVLLNVAFPIINSTYSGGTAGICNGDVSDTYGAQAGSDGSAIAGITAFQNGTFTFPGACGLPLPITLLSYSALPSGSSVDLNWSIIPDDEQYFIIERSNNAKDFQQVATVAKHGAQHYAAKDLMPYQGTSYYRLSYVNTDGRKIFLGIRRVNLNNASHQLTLVPNPATTEVYIESLQEAASLKLFSLSGQEVFSSSLNPGESFSVAVLTPGMYILSITSSSISETHRLVVE